MSCRARSIAKGASAIVSISLSLSLSRIVVYFKTDQRRRERERERLSMSSDDDVGAKAKLDVENRCAALLQLTSAEQSCLVSREDITFTLTYFRMRGECIYFFSNNNHVKVALFLFSIGYDMRLLRGEELCSLLLFWILMVLLIIYRRVMGCIGCI